MRISGLSLNSDHHQISPCNINAYSTPEVRRIKDTITQGELLKEKYGNKKGEFVLGYKGLRA